MRSVTMFAKIKDTSLLCKKLILAKKVLLPWAANNFELKI
jgi:hypothetical protein